jgi:glucosamine-6-phosphate deaminase
MFANPWRSQGDDETMSIFDYSPSQWVPFRDKAVLERVRHIKREDITKHPNPDFQIRVIPDSDVEFLWITDMFYRIKQAADADQPLVMILPNPCSLYRQVAVLINKFKVNCRNLYAFGMDEYANEQGLIAPETWPQGLIYAMKQNLYYRIDEQLRPPERQIAGFTNANIKDYGKMIADMGGADVCYSGAGWTGHLAFVEPDAPEFQADLDEWKTMGPRIVTLSPFTLAQNSLHGSFGMSGDIALVPPKAATIGPAEVIASKARLDFNCFTIHGTATTWQRLITRLVAHGPVTPRLPSSIHQLLRTDFYISETIAQDIEPDWEKGY